MRTVAILLLVACAVIAVSAQSADESPAIMTKPAAGLKKPLIFAPVQVGAAADGADAPLTGAVPATLKKATVTENIFGGAVEFENATTPNGCPCQRPAPQKFRYDAQFRKPVVAAAPCGCANATAPVAPDAHLPPVVAKLYRERVNVTAAAPCVQVAAPLPTKIVPKYYPNRIVQVQAAAPCANPAVAAKPATVTPSFYGETKAERAARRAERKTRDAARQARRVARRGTPGK